MTWSEEDGQVPFEMVQRKIFGPALSPFTGDEGDAALVIVPVPEINVHAPVPIAGVFPANKDEGEQIV